MHFYTVMPTTLLPFFKTEIELAHNSLLAREFSISWHHYERAHIIGQKYPYQHTLIHWKMLLFGIYIKNVKEIFGQIPRLIFGGVKSFVGVIPTGNTGGANVPPLKSMKIPTDLQDILERHS